MHEQMDRTARELPSKPREPDLSECCQRNCVNCVFVYYEKALARWEKKIKELEATKS